MTNSFSFPIFSRRFPSVFGKHFDDLFNDVFTLDESEKTYTPYADIVENEKDYTITVDIPGIDKEGINIEAENGVLKIEGVRKYEKKDGGRYERFLGKFKRSWQIDGVIDADKIEAEVKDGVLTLVLPKREEVLQREKTIKVFVK